MAAKICASRSKNCLRNNSRPHKRFAISEPQARFDRGHTTGFEQYGLKFEFVYYVLSPNFLTYRDIQQRVNFQIMDLLEDMSLAFAVPGRAAILANPPMQ